VAEVVLASGTFGGGVLIVPDGHSHQTDTRLRGRPKGDVGEGLGLSLSNSGVSRKKRSGADHAGQGTSIREPGF
jgi:hypothetical protein